MLLCVLRSKEFFHKHRVCTVVMACKSGGPVRAIDPFLVSELASKFGFSLAEGSTDSEEGKKRVRDCLQHLIKKIAQARLFRADEALGYTSQRHRHDLPSTPQALTTIPSQTLLPPAKSNLESEPSTFDIPDAGPGPEALSISDFLASTSVMDRCDENDDDELSEDEATSWATTSRRKIKSDASTFPPDGTSFGLLDPDSDDGTDDDEDRGEESTHVLKHVQPNREGQVPPGAPPAEAVQALLYRSSRGFETGLDAIAEDEARGAFVPPVGALSSLTSPSVTAGGHFPLAVYKKGRAKEPVYVPIAELFDRFFFAVVAMSDPEFLSAVLVFYRAFAHPEDLLDEFAHRFEGLAGVRDMDQGLVRHALVQVVGVFHDWIRDSPGDLSAPGMQPTLQNFACRIAREPFTAPLLSSLQPHLAACATAIDVDVMWSYSSPHRPSPSGAARQDAYRQSMLVRSDDQGAQRARAAFEALTPGGLSMLKPAPSTNPSSSAPVTSSARSATTRGSAASRSRNALQSGQEPRGVAGQPPAGVVGAMDRSHVPTSLASLPPQTPSGMSEWPAAHSGYLNESRTSGRTRSSSVLTVSSEKGSVKSWWTGGSGSSANAADTTSPRPSTPVVEAAPSSPSTIEAGTAISTPEGGRDQGKIHYSKEQDRSNGKNRDQSREKNKDEDERDQQDEGNDTHSSSLHPSRPPQAGSSSSSVPASTNANMVIPSPMRDPGKVPLQEISNGILNADEGAIAMELTRIEWELFRVIGPRDYLRHALVKPRERIPHGLVAKSINHFNYVSALVASYILVQPKVKTRARMLEKMIRVAVRLRMCNNYNTLQAVLAGINCTAVHRLRHTRALVQENKELHKRFLSLARLMRADRASAAYRLALENSSGRIIPFIGVHLHDILSTADGNVSRRPSDGAVHWRKFSLLHDAIGTLTRAQRAGASAPPIESQPDLTRLILDVPILDEEEAWQASLLIEPKTTTTAQSLLRKMQGS